MTKKTGSLINTILPEKLQEKIDLHPCFGKKNIMHHARIHLPVARQCNINCRFCNRKYDCICESRPGVTSSILTPQEALERVELAFEKIPQLRVVGIAGPGDPLANHVEVFETLRLIHTRFPDFKLCLGTNGLLLPETASALAETCLEYITVTVNAVDPVVGEKVIAWINYNGKRHSGLEGVKILQAQQRKGIEMMARLGVLVKVNTVLIPGINDEHIADVARHVKEWGAVMLNIVPMISVEGSAFADRQPPNLAAVLNARRVCEEIIPLMSHCRQCRADAVGLLCEDRSREFAMGGSTPPNSSIDGQENEMHATSHQPYRKGAGCRLIS